MRRTVSVFPRGFTRTSSTSPQNSQRIWRQAPQGHAREFPRAFGNRLEHRDALGAEGESVSRILHVAASVNSTVGVLNGGAYLKMGKRRVRMASSVERRLHQGVQVITPDAAALS